MIGKRLWIPGKRLWLALSMVLCPLTLHSEVTGFLKIPDIPGESQAAGHEDEIDIHGVSWRIEQGAADQVGRGRARARAQVGPILASKFVDASSPYLVLATMQGKSFPEMVLVLRKDSGDTHLDYLTITMENVTVVSYDLKTEDGKDQPSEVVGFVFENVTYKYVTAAGDEHEITYDIAAGV